MSRTNWIILLAAGLLAATSGCEKVRQAVRQAVEEQQQEQAGKSAEQDEAGGIHAGLDQLRTAVRSRAVAAARGSAEIRQLDAAGFDSFVAQEDRVVVIDFYADWCGPCRMLGPRLESVVRGFGPQVALGKVNTDRNRELAAKWRVRGIPDVRVFRDGKQVDAFVGVRDEAAIRSLLERQVAMLPPPGGDEATAEGEPERTEPAIQRMEKDWRPPGVEPR